MNVTLQAAFINLGDSQRRSMSSYMPIRAKVKWDVCPMITGKSSIYMSKAVVQATTICSFSRKTLFVMICSGVRGQHDRRIVRWATCSEKIYSLEKTVWHLSWQLWDTSVRAGGRQGCVRRYLPIRAAQLYNCLYNSCLEIFDTL